jgi:hypothetical protein
VICADIGTKPAAHYSVGLLADALPGVPRG